MDRFHKDILKVVRSIPKGMVASYGQVAAYVGEPKATREAGWAMRDLGDMPDFPWWRVLNNAGRISIQDNPSASPERQQQLLESEGVEFIEPLLLDIERYRYRADKAVLASYGLAPEHIEETFKKYGLNQLPLL